MPGAGVSRARRALASAHFAELSESWGKDSESTIYNSDASVPVRYLPNSGSGRTAIGFRARCGAAAPSDDSRRGSRASMVNLRCQELDQRATWIKIHHKRQHRCCFSSAHFQVAAPLSDDPPHDHDLDDAMMTRRRP
jgi:hypothetical protein